MLYSQNLQKQPPPQIFQTGPGSALDTFLLSSKRPSPAISEWDIIEHDVNIKQPPYQLPFGLRNASEKIKSTIVLTENMKAYLAWPDNLIE